MSKVAGAVHGRASAFELRRFTTLELGFVAGTRIGGTPFYSRSTHCDATFGQLVFCDLYSFMHSFTENCYPPDLDPSVRLHMDLDVVSSSDPAHAEPAIDVGGPNNERSNS